MKKKYAVDYFVDEVIEKWKENGTVTDKNEEDSRRYIFDMLDLLTNYNFQCLLKTLIEVDEMSNKFDWDEYE